MYNFTGKDSKFNLHLLAIIFIAVLSFLMMKYNIFTGVIFLIIDIILLMMTLKQSAVEKQEVVARIKELEYVNDEVMKKSMINLPIPFCVINFDGIIQWHNRSFGRMINTIPESQSEKEAADSIEHDDNESESSQNTSEGKSDEENEKEKEHIELMNRELLGMDLGDLVEDLSLRKNLKDEGEMYLDIEYKGRKYTIVYNVMKTKVDDTVKYMMVLYWLDGTDREYLASKLENTKNTIALIQIDGYEDVLKSAEEDIRPKIKMDVEQLMSEFAEETKGALIRIDRANYVLVIDHENLKKLEANKFSILDKVRMIEHGDGLPVTLSMGVGHEGETISENMSLATGALDLALGRGGDQVVIKTVDDFVFYGGKSKAAEKKTKVKSRLIGHALEQIIQQSKNVLIMGHRYPDMDAMGAAVGIYDLCRNLNKPANVVLGGVNEAIEIFHNKLVNDEYYDGMYITHDEARDICRPDTVVIVVDTHRPNFTECPELLEISNKKVVIDHHRRGVEFISDAVLLFHEIYVSSTCEMVTELIQYMDEDLKINKLTAEGLMGGIFLDTKNFAFKTGVRTFEAASFLRQIGVNTTDVKEFFNSNLEDFLIKADIIRNTSIIDEKICLAYASSEMENMNIAIAQSADELLNIKDVEASFVLGKSGDEIFISARSLGNINVHVLMEKIGGGGHIDIAGAQLKNMSMDEAYNKVKQIIEEYLEEEENESNIS